MIENKQEKRLSSEKIIQNLTLFSPSLCSDQELYEAISSHDLNRVKNLNHGKGRFNELMSKKIKVLGSDSFSLALGDYYIHHPSSFFYYACRSATPEIIQYMLENNANIEENRFNESPIKHALMSSRIDIFEVLAKCGANVNYRKDEGFFTLLHIATCVFSGTYLIELLLKYGASPVLKDNKGLTAADYAMKNYNEEGDLCHFEKAKCIMKHAHVDVRHMVLSEQNMKIFLNLEKINSVDEEKVTKKCIIF